MTSATDLPTVTGTAAEWHAHVARAHLPVLLLTAAHLTGDPSLLRPAWRPRAAEDGTLLPLPPEEDRVAREACADRLAAWVRAGEPRPAPVDGDLAAAVLRWTGLECTAAHLG